MTLHCRASVFVGIALATTSLTAQTRLQCADNPTSMTNVSTDANGAVLSRSDYTCSFNRGELAINCQVSTSQSTGGIQQTTRTTYASVDDFVDQYTVTPHLQRQQKMETRGVGEGRDITYTYDAKKRMVREDHVSPSAHTWVVWTEWDTAGRPTRGTWSSKTPAMILAPNDSITYDDKAKTIKRLSGGQSAVQTEIELYKNGNQTVVTAVSNGRKFIATMTTLTSEKICR